MRRLAIVTIPLLAACATDAALKITRCEDEDSSIAYDDASATGFSMADAAAMLDEQHTWDVQWTGASAGTVTVAFDLAESATLVDRVDGDIECARTGAMLKGAGTLTVAADDGSFSFVRGLVVEVWGLAPEDVTLLDADSDDDAVTLGDALQRRADEELIASPYTVDAMNGWFEGTLQSGELGVQADWTSDAAVGNATVVDGTYRPR